MREHYRASKSVPAVINITTVGPQRFHIGLEHRALDADGTTMALDRFFGTLEAWRYVVGGLGGKRSLPIHHPSRQNDGDIALLG